MANKKISALEAVTTPASDDVLPIVNASETKKINLGQLQQFMSVACRLATTADVDLATGGLMDVDGITTAAGNRILVWQQADAKENGIYIAAESSWTRAANFSDARNMVSGVLIPILEGMSHSNTIFQHATDGAITPGTTAIAFAKVTASSAWGGISGNITDQTDLVNKIDTDIQTAVDALKGSVPAEGDTLKKLHDRIAGGTVTVVDNLTGTSSTQALSARQGAVLKGLIDTINTLLTGDDTSLDELQEIVDFVKQNKVDIDAINALLLSDDTAFDTLQEIVDALKLKISAADITLESHTIEINDYELPGGTTEAERVANYINALNYNKLAKTSDLWFKLNKSYVINRNNVLNDIPGQIAGSSFSRDGRYAYLSLHNNACVQYEMTTPWDLSTASPIQSSPVLGQGGGLHVTTDGMHVIYVNGDLGTNPVEVYSMSTAHDLTTLSLVSSAPLNDYAVASRESEVFITDDGLQVYRRHNSGVSHYRLTSPWDVSTATLNYMLPTAWRLRNFIFSSDLTVLMVLHDYLYHYTLAIPGDLETATLLPERADVLNNLNMVVNFPRISLSGDGKYIALTGYVIGAPHNEVAILELSRPNTLGEVINLGAEGIVKNRPSYYRLKNKGSGVLSGVTPDDLDEVSNIVSTSDLNNTGEDGLHPFITSRDIHLPAQKILYIDKLLPNSDDAKINDINKPFHNLESALNVVVDDGTYYTMFFLSSGVHIGFELPGTNITWDAKTTATIDFTGIRALPQGNGVDAHIIRGVGATVPREYHFVGGKISLISNTNDLEQQFSVRYSHGAVFLKGHLGSFIWKAFNGVNVGHDYLIRSQGRASNLIIDYLEVENANKLIRFVAGSNILIKQLNYKTTTYLPDTIYNRDDFHIVFDNIQLDTSTIFSLGKNSTIKNVTGAGKLRSFKNVYFEDAVFDSGIIYEFYAGTLSGTVLSQGFNIVGVWATGNLTFKNFKGSVGRLLIQDALYSLNFEGINDITIETNLVRLLGVNETEISILNGITNINQINNGNSWFLQESPSFFNIYGELFTNSTNIGYELTYFNNVERGINIYDDSGLKKFRTEDFGIAFDNGFDFDIINKKVISKNKQILLDISGDLLQSPNIGTHVAKQYLIPANTLKKNSLLVIKIRLTRLAGSGNPFMSLIINPGTKRLINGINGTYGNRHLVIRDTSFSVFGTSGSFFDDLDSPTLGDHFVTYSIDRTVDNLIDLQLRFSTANSNEFRIEFISIEQKRI